MKKQDMQTHNTRNNLPPYHGFHYCFNAYVEGVISVTTFFDHIPETGLFYAMPETQSMNTYPPVALLIGRVLPETHFSAKKPPETPASAVQPLPDDKNVGTRRLAALKQVENDALKERFHDMNKFIRAAGAGSLCCTEKGRAIVTEYLEMACSLTPGLKEYLDENAQKESHAYRFYISQIFRSEDSGK